ncbi:sensor domain-containing diguanylate cyclase [Pseudaeromonas paramecii]|uniref:GGDEF domain-containing protein n=1 Tax=Pseudaeromonas paramecii TaxID=2138166 RepID=A0ABP8QHQ0_9GAMM
MAWTPDPDSPDAPTRQQLLEVISLQTDIAKLGLDLSGVMNLVVERALPLVNADGAVVELAEGEDMVYRAASGLAQEQLGLRLKLHGSLSGLCVRTGEVLTTDDSEQDPRVNLLACRKLGLRSMIALPLHHQAVTVGVLKVMARAPAHFRPQQAAVLTLLTEVLAAEIFFAAKYAADDLFYRATHDELTGLANRALFLDKLRSALSLQRRQEGALAVLMIDMDGLKLINDCYGHGAGDAAICEFSRRLKQSVRATDTVARLGGDEFAVLMPAIANPALLEQGTQRLMAKVNHPFHYPKLDEELTLSASMGAALAPEDGCEPDELLEKADQAMYQMKRRRKQAEGGEET